MDEIETIETVEAIKGIETVEAVESNKTMETIRTVGTVETEETKRVLRELGRFASRMLKVNSHVALERLKMSQFPYASQTLSQKSCIRLICPTLTHAKLLE